MILKVFVVLFLNFNKWLIIIIWFVLDIGRNFVNFLIIFNIVVISSECILFINKFLNYKNVMFVWIIVVWLGYNCLV